MAPRKPLSVKLYDGDGRFVKALAVPPSGRQAPSKPLIGAPDVIMYGGHMYVPNGLRSDDGLVYDEASVYAATAENERST